MSGRAGRAGGGEAAVERGRCGNLFDAMPELEAINPDGFPGGEHQREFQPRYEALRELNAQYVQALRGGSSMSATVKAGLLTGLITEAVKNAAYPILQGLFGNKPQDMGQPDMNSMLECILNGLIEDLDILRLIQMVAKITITVYYGEDWCRIGLAAAFVGSTVYVSWNAGISQVFSLGANGCMFVLSALSGCYQFINEPEAFMREFMPLLGVTIPQIIGGFVKVLNDNVDNHAVFATLIAQSNVALMGRIYGAAGFQPYADLRAAGADGLPADAAAADAAAAAGGAGGAGGAAAAGGAGGAAAAAAAHLAAAAAAAAPGGPSDLCARMYAELIKGAAVSKRYAIQYFLKLIDGIRKIRYVLPGQLNRPEERVYHRCCLFLTGSIQGLIDSLGAQADLAGLDLTEITTKILLDYLLPSKLRGLVAMGDEYNAKNEVYLLAHRIQNTVIACIVALRNGRLTRELFVSCFPIFGSELRVENVARLVQSRPEYVLSRYNDLLGRLLHQQQQQQQQQQDEVGMEGDSIDSKSAVYSDSQPPDRRDATLFEDFNKRVHIMGDIFATPEEKADALRWFQENESWIWRILTIPDRYITQTVKRALKCEMAQHFGEIASTELRRCAAYFEPAAPAGQNTFNFPPIDRIWTDQVKWVFKFISNKTEEGKTPTEIITLLQTMFGYPNLESFKDFFSLLMLRCKLSALLSPEHNTFDFFITKEGAGAEGGRVMLNIDSTNKSIGTTGKLESKVMLHIDFLSDPVPVPDTVTKVVRGASDVLWSLLPMGGASCQADGDGTSAINPPAAEIEKNGQRNKKLIQSMAAQDQIIHGAMVADAAAAGGGGAAAAGGGAAALAPVDKVVADQISNGVGSATDAIDIVLVPQVLEELAQQQDVADAGAAAAADAAAAAAVAGGEMNMGLDVPSRAKSNQSTQPPTAEEKESVSKMIAAAAVTGDVMDEQTALSKVRRQNRIRQNVSNLKQPQGGKSRKNTKRTRRNKGRKSSKAAKKTQQRRSSRYRRSSRKGRK